MDTSILNTIKKLLGVAPDYTAFDSDIIVNINTTFLTLRQLGVGPAVLFSIEDDAATWTDYLGTSDELSMVKNYMYLKTKIVFDPPPTSFALESLNKQIAELEWRLNVEVDDYIPEVVIASE